MLKIFNWLCFTQIILWHLGIWWKNYNTASHRQCFLFFFFFSFFFFFVQYIAVVQAEGNFVNLWQRKRETQRKFDMQKAKKKTWKCKIIYFWNSLKLFFSYELRLHNEVKITYMSYQRIYHHRGFVRLKFWDWGIAPKPL